MKSEGTLTRPSKIPVPSVATLGATYHSLSLSLVNWSWLVTSSGLRSGIWSAWTRQNAVRNRKRTSRDILLVGKYQQKSVLHFAVVDDLVKL